jgi:hypothetical protein
MINPEAMLAFSVWYSTQRLGRIQSLPAFDPKSFETAVKDATGLSAPRLTACSLLVWRFRRLVTNRHLSTLRTCKKPA